MFRKLKTVVVLLLALVFAGQLRAAISNATVFEVRPTVGSDANGGGFVTGASGTDWSQQTSPQYSLTGLTTSGAAALVATTSASTDMVGNLIQITSGTNFTPGFYQILSVIAGVSITVDRNATTGVGAAGAGAIGGALATITQANSVAVGSNTVWVKATGTYTVTTALVITLDSHNSGSNQLPYSIIGYTSTRGDGGQVTWTTSTNSIDLIDFSSGSTAAVNVSIQNFNMTTTAGTKGDAIKALSSSVNTPNVSIIHCLITGFVIGIDGNAATNNAFVGLQLINTRVTGCSSHGVRNGVANTYVLGSMLDNNGGDGFSTAATFAINAVAFYTFDNSIFYKNGGNGINVAFSDASNTREELIVIKDCDLSTNTGAGLLMFNATNPLGQITNSIFDANGTYGVDNGTGIIAQSLLYTNAFFNNTTAATRGTNAGIGTITLSASPYTSLGSLDFSLNSNTGGGAALKGAGFPGVLQAGGTGHADVGALQSTGSAGGGQVGYPIVQ